MPSAAGVRALLSSAQSSQLTLTLPCRACCRASSRLPIAAAHSRAALQHSPRRRAARSFHSSPSVLSRPDDSPNGEDLPNPPPSTPPTDSNPHNGAAAENRQPVETSAEATAAAAAEAKREKLKSAGYGSARARANRGNRVDEAAVLELPNWVVRELVHTYEEAPLDSSDLVLPELPTDLAKLAEWVDNIWPAVGLTEASVNRWKRTLATGAAFNALLTEVQNMHSLAFYLTLALSYHPRANPDHIEWLRWHHESSGLGRLLPQHWLHGNPQHQYFATVRFDAAPGSGTLHRSPLGRRPEVEYPACEELLTAVKSQLASAPPARAAANLQESRRPPIVLTLLNRKSVTDSRSIVDDLATDLKADVVHLSAQTIARVVGQHLGQNQYSARGSVSMLGYAAAEMNGRLAPRPDPEPEQEVGLVAISLPSRLGSFLSPRSSSFSGSLDGRWEEMKIGAALDTMVAAADLKRRNAAEPGVELPPRPLVIHVHDYVELSSLQPSIIRKLQAIADRMWMAGRQVVLVGTSSGDMDRTSQWRDKLLDLGRDGAHLIPFHMSEKSRFMEKQDNVRENLINIHDMLRAMVGTEVPIFTVDTIIAALAPDPDHDVLYAILSQYLYDAQWVYRVASTMVGSPAPPLEKYRARALMQSLINMREYNKHWSRTYPSVRPPYFSPLLVSPKSTNSPSSSPSPFFPGEPATSNLTGAAAHKEYNSDEKKLLSGLINAKDIHTTFKDIIVPQETKESLIGLTTLSLVRPEAFSYGVLRTERIPGCLLYGPPGTGKTLLAKAVAKESGASMLEVSAASIMDKWVGQSEKNVQALFSLARKLAPCVIFLDEADALLAARGSGPGGAGGGRAAHRETITQFLREWDGLTSDLRAFIMVATNRPFDLDEAVLRRLPRKILVDLPLAPERESILRVMLREETLAEDVNLVRLAGAETELYSGSDLKNLCVSAAMEAVREEMRAKEAWTGDGEYQFPERRVLTRAHFEKGLREISASISGDMESLKAIRKFDQQFGDAGRKRNVRRGMGFEVVPEKAQGSEEARVRQVGVAS